MKSFLQLLHLFFEPMTGSRWLFRPGLVLLPLVILLGVLHSHNTFKLVVADYIILMVFPFMMAPKVLRTLISNRRFALVPGFLSRAILTAFVFTLLQISFIPFFAWCYGIAGSHLRNALVLFIISSAYVAIMQYAVTTVWAMIGLSLLPVTGIYTVVSIMQDGTATEIGNGWLVLLLALTLLGWLLAWQRARKRHQFRQEHKSLEFYKHNGYQRAALATWLLPATNAGAAPEASLLLGYPATLATRVRIIFYMLLLGPTVATLFITFIPMGGTYWSLQPSMLDIFLGASVFPASFAAFQNIDWVARLRLLWLRCPTQRHEFWQLLEQQLLINTTLLVLICCGVALADLKFSTFSVTLLLHYPLLILTFNLCYSYYVICARASMWSPALGFMFCIAGSTFIFGGLWAAIVYHHVHLLLVLELLAIIAALMLRRLARSRLHTVDWLLVKPLRTM